MADCVVSCRPPHDTTRMNEWRVQVDSAKQKEEQEAREEQSATKIQSMIRARKAKVNPSIVINQRFGEL